MSEPTKNKILEYFDEMWTSATIGETWKLNKEAVQMHLAIRSIILTSDKHRSMSAKWLNKWTIYLWDANLNQMEFRKKMIDMFCEAGITVEP